uniref:Lymphatic vessel endothelial hyaluronic receptor 1a n=1 Tax=Sander lucioperca TaxID=283035 RepID=A0A8C9X3Z3_SANLU
MSFISFFSWALQLLFLKVSKSNKWFPVFPAANQSIAGVFQVSDLNDLNQPQYGFNASEARRLCSALGVNIASKAQVQDALTRGLETCRFGWIDEHFAVIPRIKALSNCGKSQTGLVTWRTSVTQKFDVPLNSRDYSQQTQSPSKAATSTRTTQSTTSSSTPKTIDNEAAPARFVSSVQSFAGGMRILFTRKLMLWRIFLSYSIHTTYE